MLADGFLPVAAGLALLALGAELIVRGGARLASSLGVKPMVLGLTVVAIGTSIPELLVGIAATGKEAGGLAVGNIAGTNVVNILFILGLSALLRPLALELRVFRLELPAMILAAGLLTLLVYDGALARADGLVLLLGAVPFSVMLVWMVRGESRAVHAEFREQFAPEPAAVVRTAHVRSVSTVTLLVGIAITLLGADWLVDGAVFVAERLGVSPTVIGLTIVALGTSAPELATTVVSTLRDERDIAVGNLLGSSVYNILVILGFTAVAAPSAIPVEPALLQVDIPVMSLVALLCIPVFVTGREVSRLEGGAFVAMYVAYIAYLIAART